MATISVFSANLFHIPRTSLCRKLVNVDQLRMLAFSVSVMSSKALFRKIDFIYNLRKSMNTYKEF